MVVGALTIGQSPRSDVLSDIRDHLGPGVEIVERGALDGLEPEEVGAFYPGTSDRTLVTRMSDGTEVVVAERHILPRLQVCIDELEELGAEVLILLCTGGFPGLESGKILLQPYRIIQSIVRGVVKEGGLGVIVPSSGQVPAALERWGGAGLKVSAAAVSPYSSTGDEILETANQTGKWNADLILLDCIGFDRKTGSLFREVTGKPVLLPRNALAMVLKEIVEGKSLHS